MWISKSNRFILPGVLLCLILFGNISAQQSKNDFLPKYPVKSAIIYYNIKHEQSDRKESFPFISQSFDFYGALVAIENIDESAIIIRGGTGKEIFKDGYIYLVGNPKGCATKNKIKDYSYSVGTNAGFNKQVQDLIHKKINKNNNKSFISFNKTGTINFLGLTCATYEYKVSNDAFSSIDKYLFIVYSDICLSWKYYFGNNLLTTIEATSFEENISIPSSVFEVPENYRIIDGDKLDVKNENAVSEFSTIIIDFTTNKNYGQIKEEGKKTLYVKDNGKTSAQDWEGTIVQFDLPPETKHLKIIRDEEYEYFVDYGEKTTRKRDLWKNNYNDKSIAELNYIFENNLYDNSVKFFGKTNFLGKDCSIFEIRIGVEKLEVYEWHGVYLKVKKFICTDGDECSQSMLMLEETATHIQENVPISNSIFQYPEKFQLIIN